MTRKSLCAAILTAGATALAAAPSAAAQPMTDQARNEPLWNAALGVEALQQCQGKDFSLQQEERLGRGIRDAGLAQGSVGSVLTNLNNYRILARTYINDRGCDIQTVVTAIRDFDRTVGRYLQ